MVIQDTLKCYSFKISLEACVLILIRGVKGSVGSRSLKSERVLFLVKYVMVLFLGSLFDDSVPPSASLYFPLPTQVVEWTLQLQGGEQSRGEGGGGGTE